MFDNQTSENVTLRVSQETSLWIGTRSRFTVFGSKGNIFGKFLVPGCFLILVQKTALGRHLSAFKIA